MSIPSGSQSFRKLNPHLFAPDMPAKKRIRQETKPLLNKLETEWFKILQSNSVDLYAQAIRFKLANGVWYKPDMVCFKSMQVWEVKGPFAHRGGLENLKIAAHQYKDFEFLLVWKEQGEWKQQLVLS